MIMMVTLVELVVTLVEMMGTLVEVVDGGVVSIATVEKQLDVRPDRSADRLKEIDCSPKLSQIFPNCQPHSNYLCTRIMMTTMVFHTLP